MSLLKLQNQLINDITSINNVQILEKIKQFIEIANLHHGIHVFNDEQRKRVLDSLEQYQNGNFLTSEEAEEDIKQLTID